MPDTNASPEVLNGQQQQGSNEPSAQLLDDIFQSLNQSRRQYEMRWYLIDNFWENNHFVKSLNQLGQLEPLKFPKGIQIRPIPRAKKQIKAAVNILLANDPKWVIYPDIDPDELASQANDPQLAQKYTDHVKRISQWLDDLWHFLYLKDAIAEGVQNAEKHNVCYWEIGADAEGNVFIDTYEAYDIWHDAGLKNVKEADVLIKAVNRTLDYVRKVKGGEFEERTTLAGEKTFERVPGSTSGFLYDPSKTKELKPEQRQALSDWKDVKLREKSRGMSKAIEDPKIAKVFLKEVWMRNSEGTFDLITECQGKKLRFVQTDLTEVPFVSYSPNRGTLLQSSEMEDLIPMNKAIDILTAMVEGYTRTMTIGRYLIPKGAKVTRMLNEHGEMVEYEGQVAPQAMNPAPLPGTVFSTIQLYTGFMDEVGASFTAFGKAPKGVKAYKAIESMRSQEFSNRKDSIDMLSTAIEQIAEKILDLGDRYFMNPVTIKHLTDGQPDYFKLVSANSTWAMNPDNHVIPVSAKMMVKCEIEQGMSYTEEGKRDTYMQLAEGGFLPREEVLKAFKFSNVKDIVAAIDREIQQKAAMEQGAKGGDQQQGKQEAKKGPSTSISFKDLPPDGKVQLADQAGIKLAPEAAAGAPPAANQPQKPPQPPVKG